MILQQENGSCRFLVVFSVNNLVFCTINVFFVYLQSDGILCQIYRFSTELFEFNIFLLFT
jgi:hypothetical protein